LDPIKLPLREIQRSRNVDALLTTEQSDHVAAEVVKAYEEDKASRKEWETRTDNAIKLALQMVEQKSFPWPDAANVKFPLVTIAALQFAARAYPALVKAPDLVKYRVMGADQNGQKAARAARISRHMSYQLLDKDEDWEEDTDRKFITVPIIGCAFKKTYWDPLKQRNCSKLVLPQNLIVHYYTRTLEACERKTEIFELSDREIREKQLSGLYSERDLGQPQLQLPKLADQRQGLTPPPQGKSTARELLEQHCYWDFDGDGYPEPYIITVDRSSRKTLRIVHRFGEVVTEQSMQVKELTDQKKMLGLKLQEMAASLPPPTGEESEDQLSQATVIANAAQTIQKMTASIDQQIAELEQSDEQEPRVLRIEAMECYTKYGFIPSPDGGFYDLGLGALLGPINDSVNTLINQLLDSGTLQNGSQGFIGKGARIKGGEVRFRPFEWKRVDVAGQTLKESLVPLPINQPSNVLFQLLSLLINYGEKVSSVNEAMMGNNPGQNTPAYNMQAMLEQGLQVFNGIFKRLYRAFRRELRKLYTLNRIYLNPIEYYETMDGRFQVLQNDYAGDPNDVFPAADPNAFSSQENMMKAQFLAARAATVPGYHLVNVERRLHEAMDIPDSHDVFPVDDQGNPMIPAPRNPELDLQIAEEQRRTLEAQTRMEIDTALADSQIAVNESQILKTQYELQQGDADLMIQQFEALTARIDANSKRIKAIADDRKSKQPRPAAN
jgi:chaperonin GroES